MYKFVEFVFITVVSVSLTVVEPNYAALNTAVQYEITYSIGDHRYARTRNSQYVKIKGTNGETDEIRCDEDFYVHNLDVVCVFESYVDIGEYRCVTIRTGGSDGLLLAQVKVQIDGIETHTIIPQHSEDYIGLDDGETKEFCLEAVQYEITYSIGDHRYARTRNSQYVKIKGTNGETDEIRCDEDFYVHNLDVLCVFESYVDIGEYRCVTIRTGGTDGLLLAQVKVQIDGIKTHTIGPADGEDSLGLDDGETKEFCLHGASEDDRTDMSTAAGESYNYFNLVRQWTPNMCYKAKKSCRNMPSYVSEWTIHGLWPSYNEYDWPEDCQNHCVLRSSEISHLEREMNREWPTSYSSQNYGFWRHEYCKHGTCCTDKFRTAADYFKGALNLHQKYDMDRALRNGGIVPSTAKAYRVSDFDRALKNAFGVSKVGYWCRYAKDSKGIYRQLLWQVSLCISKSLNVVECPADDDGACNRSKPVLFLPYSVL